MGQVSKSNCDKCGRAIVVIGLPGKKGERCILCATEEDYSSGNDVTVPKSLLVECAILASSYEALAIKEPYAGRDPATEQPRDPGMAAKLRRQIDAILEGARA